jgi:hypothetical protein
MNKISQAYRSKMITSQTFRPHDDWISIYWFVEGNYAFIIDKLLQHIFSRRVTMRMEAQVKVVHYSNTKSSKSWTVCSASEREVTDLVSFLEEESRALDLKIERMSSEANGWRIERLYTLTISMAEIDT